MKLGEADSDFLSHQPGHGSPHRPRNRAPLLGHQGPASGAQTLKPMCPAFFIDEHHCTETCPVCTAAFIAMDAMPDSPLTLEPPIEANPPELLHA